MLRPLGKTHISGRQTRLMTSAHQAPASRARNLVLASALAALYSPAAFAELNDNLHPYVAISYNHENNLLRLGDAERDTQEASDTFRTVTAGLLADAQVGRQKFTAQAKVSRVNFDRFSELDYNGKDAFLTWEWVLGNHLSGRAGTAYSETLASFADFHEPLKNVRKKTTMFADGAWRFHPSWQVRAGAATDKYSYDLTQQSYNSRTEDSLTAGVDYLPTTGSSIGLQVRNLKSGYPHNEQLANVSLDNGYEQNELKLKVNWVQSAVTQVLFLGGWVQRKHETSKERDDTGINARLIGSWGVRERLHLTGMLWREYAAAEGSLINSALMTGASLGAVWDVAAKVSLDATVRSEKRDFKPFLGTAGAAVLPGSAYTDKTQYATAGVTYRPIQAISLNLTAFRESRSGSVAANSNSFKANGISFSASGIF